jgi:RNA polymerase sigma factor (sigma-70 family)
MGQGKQTATGTTQRERAPESDAARKRAAVEMIAGHESSLKRTARRYSIDAEDAEDAYQRALEIVLTKAPTTDPRELIRWTQTVTKHEALAVRQSREKLLGRRSGNRADGGDPVALIPAVGDSPDEQVERREVVARSREALSTLKPAELRALSLLAEGYSYAEIGSITGFSQTKINRVLAEGRDRFRSLVSSSEDGSRCRELRPLLSAFCDGETSPSATATVREHLRACARCRATMRAYRAAPRIAAALVPTLPPSRSLLERAGEFFAGLGTRLPGIGGNDAAVTQIAAAGGSRGAGMAALAKLLTICAGAAGTAACVATGVLPTPLDLAPEQRRKPTIEQVATGPAGVKAEETVQYEPAPPTGSKPEPKPKPKPPSGEEAPETSSEAPAGAIEYEPPPPSPAPEPQVSNESSSSSASSGSAAGEFGP